MNALIEDSEVVLNQMTFCPICAGLLDQSINAPDTLHCPSGHGEFTIVKVETFGDQYEFVLMFKARTRIARRVNGVPPY